MDNPPSPTKELVLLQHWTHTAFPLGHAANPIWSTVAFLGGFAGSFTMATGNLKQKENRQAI